MERSISIEDLEARPGIEHLKSHHFRQDRKDIYYLRETYHDPCTLSVVLCYGLQEMRCNPDFDW